MKVIYLKALVEKAKYYGLYDDYQLLVTYIVLQTLHAEWATSS